jgi:hypothetical protein
LGFHGVGSRRATIISVVLERIGPDAAGYQRNSNKEQDSNAVLLRNRIKSLCLRAADDSPGTYNLLLGKLRRDRRNCGAVAASVVTRSAPERATDRRSRIFTSLIRCHVLLFFQEYVLVLI